MKTIEELRVELEAKIPRDVIAQRKAGFGGMLNYLPGFYVINRLNEVIGAGNWAYSSEVFQLERGTVKTDKGEVFSVHYMAKVRLAVTLAAGITTEFTDYGYGDGTDKNSMGKAHELAIKEAVTDGLKRAARCLGNSFGNALYDKSGEGIDEGMDTRNESIPTTATHTITETPVTVTKPAVKAKEPSVAPKKQEAVPKVEHKTGREMINKLISQTSKVAIDKKLLTLDKAKEMVKAMGADTKEELTDAKATELLNQLKEILK